MQNLKLFFVAILLFASPVSQAGTAIYFDLNTWRVIGQGPTIPNTSYTPGVAPNLGNVAQGGVVQENVVLTPLPLHTINSYAAPFKLPADARFGAEYSRAVDGVK